MANPIQQQITTAIATALALLVPNTYLSNIGAHVIPWKVTPWDPAELPGIAFRDAKTDSSQATFSSTGGRHRYETEVEFIIAMSRAIDASTTADAAAYALYGDLMAGLKDLSALIKDNVKWSSLAEWTVPKTHEISIEPGDKLLGQLRLTVKVQFNTVGWDVSTQN